jgi:hypothetical protein
MEVLQIHTEVCAARPSEGTHGRRLRLGDDALFLTGLEAGLATQLDQRFGAFIRPTGSDEPAPGDYRLEVTQSHRRHWFQQQERGELYRLEAVGPPEHRVILSYHFALCEIADPDGGCASAGRRFRVALARDPNEPLGRIMDNIARFLAARAAMDRGGFAMHGAGVVRDDKAHVFAGPSRSGKSTAVGLSGPGCSLGDDFAIVVPRDGRWFVPALPFDNAETISHDPPRDLFPLVSIWRLYQAEEHAIERPMSLLAVASLMGCVAFPWAVPECADLLLARVTEVVNKGHFGHLHFRPDPDFWSLLV